MLQTNVVTDESTVMLDVASTPAGAFIVDERRRVVFWNQGASQLLGYTPEQTIGLRCCDILCAHEDTLEDCSHCLGPSTWAQLLDGEIVHHVMTAVTQEGMQKQVRMTTMLGHSLEGATRVIHFVREPRSAHAALAAQRTPASDDQAKTDTRVSRGLLPGEASGAAEPHRMGTSTLTKREREVLKLLATGLSNLEIADALKISPITARNHVTSVIEKLGVKTRLQAVIVATRKGWL